MKNVYLRREIFVLAKTTCLAVLSVLSAWVFGVLLFCL